MPKTTDPRHLRELDSARGVAGVYHPRCEEEVSALIKRGRSEGRPVRVRGSACSEPAAIFSDPWLAGRAHDAIDIMLDRLSDFHIDRARRQVTVQAGCRFGFDPKDPTGQSTPDNGLCAALDAAGLALPVLAGVSQQTIAGFFATGSEGGSLVHSLQEQIAGLTLIDGRGERHVLGSDDEAFPAAGVALGLLGVVTSVTLRCVDRFDVEGEERAYELSDAAIDLFDDGRRGLAAFFARETYARVLWWPQPGVDRLVVWKARIADGPDVDRPYEPFPRIAGSRLPMQALAGLTLRAIGTRPAAARAPAWLRHSVERALAPLYKAFVPLAEPRRFRDAWHAALPLDDTMEQRLMPVRFTEIWVDIDNAARLMRRVQALFARGGYQATGNFVCELYPAKASPFWMSPGYGRSSMRLNVFWLRHNGDHPERGFFRSFWDVSRDLDSRLHWGKVLDPTDRGHARRFPHREAFLETRARLDPDDLFLTDYWRKHLDVGGNRRSVRATSGPTSLPLTSGRPIFALRPTHLTFIEHACASFTVTLSTRAGPDQVFELFRSDARPWLSDMRDYRRLTAPDLGIGSVVDEQFWFMTLRVRTVAEQPGKRWSASVDACSLPLAERMLQDVRIEQREGRTRAEWTVYYDPLAVVAPLEPVFRPVFRRLFSRWAAAAGRHLDASVGANRASR